MKDLQESIMAKNPTVAGLSKLFNPSSSTVPDFDSSLIAKVEQERSECERCKGYPCPKSRNKGFIPSMQGDCVTLRRCEPYKEHARLTALENTFKHSGIPLRFKGKTFADYTADSNNQTAVKFAKGILLEGYSGGYFYGEVGTGKTFLAALIAQEFLKAGKSVLFEKVADLLTEFYAVYRGQGGNEDSLLSGLYNVDLLILDDFGIEKATQFVGSTLCKILDARYNREGITTIITSNYSLKQIAERLNNPTDMQVGDMCLNGSRIYDRCKEICKPILFKGDSRRN